MAEGLLPKIISDGFKKINGAMSEYSPIFCRIITIEIIGNADIYRYFSFKRCGRITLG